MPALIDNYTTATSANPLVANAWHKTNVEIIYSSIVIALHQQIGLNSRIHKLLNEFSQLQNNWDEDDAIAPSGKVIQIARYITNLLEKHGQSIFHAAPGPNGEIMLDIRNKQKNRSLEIILYLNRCVAVAFPETGRPFQKEFDFNDLPNHLAWLNREAV